MRWVIIVLVVVGLCFVGLLLFWPSPSPRSKPDGYRLTMPSWLERWVPNPPAALPRSEPPTVLRKGQEWRGRFYAKDGKLGVLRFHLTTGALLKVTARSPGQEDQILCMAAVGTPSDCKPDETVHDGKGSIVVRENDADVLLEAPAGDISLMINE